MIEKTKQKIYSLLRWSEKWTKTDMVYLAKGGGWLTFSQIWTSLTGFILAIVFANLISPNDFGAYSYITSITGILTIFTLPGINESLIVAISRGAEGDFFTALKTKIKWGIIGSIISVSISIYYYINANNIFACAFLIAAFFLPLMESLKIYSSLISGRKKFNLSFWFGTISNTFSTAILAATIILTKNILFIVLSYFFANTLIRLVLLLVITKKYTPNNIKESGTINFGKILTLTQILSNLSNKINNIIVFQFIGPAELAFYSFATLIPNKIISFIGSIDTITFPKISEKKDNLNKRNLAIKIAKYNLLLMPIIVIYIIISPFIFNFFFPQYTESIKYSNIYILNLIFAPHALFVSSLISRMKTKELFKIRTITPILKVALALLLIPFYGIYGLIFSNIFSRIVNSCYIYYLYKK